MSRQNSVSNPFQMTEAEEAVLRKLYDFRERDREAWQLIHTIGKIGTNSEELDLIDEDPDHPLHKQDWTVTTDPKESWANKETRRRSMWSRIDENNPHVPVETPTERRGSILSVWRAGKDKNGKPILAHDGETHELSSEEEVLEKEDNASPKLSARERRLSQRRGSILSLWSNGKDENGRDVIQHDDEEWKI